MQLENSFEVPAPPDRAWEYLLDVEQVAPCMPGAELTEVVDERTWKGRVVVKLGPVTLSYAGTVVMEERDDANRRIVLRATGTETRGKGAASALVTSHLEPEGSGTRVVMHTDLTISGAAAQYGRGMIADVSQRLTNEFARCIAARLSEPAPAAEGGAPAEAAPPPAAAPVSGIRLGLWALWRAVVRTAGRMWRAVRSPLQRGA